VTTPAGNNRYLTDLDIRIALRDLCPEDNDLLDDLEFSPEEIRTAQTLAIDLFNETLPIVTAFDYPDFPYRYHMLKGTIANLMFIAAHHYRRNDLTYNIPGAAVAPKNKSQEYEVIGDRLLKEYKTWVTQIKRSMNMSNAYGTIG
jgi:hypothetical protein